MKYFLDSNSGVNWSFAPVYGFSEIPESVSTAFADGAKLATVPGCVHDDLLTYNLIPDPYLGTNEHKTHWIGQVNWLYECEFYGNEVDFFESDNNKQNYDLVFEGIDTAAKITLNGHKFDGFNEMSVQNMHRTHSFNIKNIMSAGKNILSIEFCSAYKYSDLIKKQLGHELSGTPGAPWQYFRKMACNYGWDWGPTVVTAGIWKNIYINKWENAQIKHGFIKSELVQNDGNNGKITANIHAILEQEITENTNIEDYKIEFALCEKNENLKKIKFSTDKQSKNIIVGKKNEILLTTQITVNNIKKWFPHSFGEQNLYTLTVQLLFKNQVKSEKNYQIGFRNVGFNSDWEYSENGIDTIGKKFALSFNGQEYFAVGYNWIPTDALVSRSQRDDYYKPLKEAKEAGANIIRVWGGGIYEKDIFYDICDELGLLVWQDFPFACAAYPETPEFLEEVKLEAIDNISRIGHRASLVFLCGNNENQEGFQNWGWQKELNGKPWGKNIYHTVLPSVLKECHNTLPYWPGSPYSGIFELSITPPNFGDNHYWVPWNNKDYSEYASIQPRFCSEYGWQAPPSYLTMLNCLGEQNLEPNSVSVALHQKAIGGMAKLARGINWHFSFSPENKEALDIQSTTMPIIAGDAPDTSSLPRYDFSKQGLTKEQIFDIWHYLAQIVQARAMEFSTKYYRGLAPKCAGTIIWQLNDCWPVISWALIDKNNNKKLAYFGAKEAFKSQFATISPNKTYLENGKKASLVMVNNTNKKWVVSPKITRYNTLGTALYNVELKEYVINEFSSLTVELESELTNAQVESQEFIIVDTLNNREVKLFTEDADFNFPKPEYSVEIDNPTYEKTHFVTIKAHSLIVQGVLQVDRLVEKDVLNASPNIDSNLITLLPNESHRFIVSGLNRKTPIKENEIKFPVFTSVGEVENMLKGL